MKIQGGRIGIVPGSVMAQAHLAMMESRIHDSRYHEL